MRQQAITRVSFLMFCVAALLLMNAVSAQEADESGSEKVYPLDESGRLVRFERDIAPLLRTACLECHGPDDAKNDFRVDDQEIFLEYIEAEDAESSTLYVDYLTIDDEDMLMPPESHGGPLSPAELALFRVWINEGANWPEGFELVESSGTSAGATAPIAPPVPKTLSERVWTAQGFLHPATVHFPIALFLLGGAFVVLGWKWPAVGTQVPLACLVIGALSAIASTVMGWSFAPAQGFGSGWNIMDWDREIDVHRWSGLIVTVFSSVLALIALIAVWRDSESLNKTWKIGLLLCAAMVGAVGHQGGELSYGEDFYPRAWRILIGETEKAASAGETEPTGEATQTADGSLPAEVT